MTDFVKFRNAVSEQFKTMEKANELFRVDLDKNDLWDAYLASFPEGTNPIYKERTEHDCNCCKQFIRDMGAVVSISNGVVTSIWDISLNDDTYQPVADAMAKIVRGAPIKGIFRHNVSKVGTEFSRQVGEDGAVIRWNHFSAKLPKKVLASGGKSVEQLVGHANDNYSVFKRSIEEITPEAVSIVQELIDQNSLYRGQEHKKTVSLLKEYQNKVRHIVEENPDADKDVFMWGASAHLGPRGRIRNTVIGTLMTDISDGVDLEKAVKSFEQKVAPHNYKRPTALITQSMINKAQETIEELGLESALYRRYATESDLTINNVLFADRSTQGKMKGGVLGDLKPTAKQKAPDLDKVQEVGIQDFIDNILPKAESLELYVGNRHTSNLASLVAPVYSDAPNIFKWDNGFSWSYNGGVTDSEIRQSVSSRGGRVDGVFRFSHMWNYEGSRNTSLMDLHVFMPGASKTCENAVNDQYGNAERVGWNHREHYRSGGVQDVDYTDQAPLNYVPVENITFPDIDKMPDGEYVCMIHNWNLRQPTSGGFKAEIEFGGQLFEYEVTRPLKHKEWIKVATVTLKNGTFTIDHHLPVGAQSQETWGVSTEQFVKVNMVLNSPNHWDSQEVGNKHWFFILDGCANPEPARGFYNEFLKGELEPHRKVFEVLGSKMKTDESNEQLSGLGFSSTKKNDILCKVRGSFNRTIKIKF